MSPSTLSFSQLCIYVLLINYFTRFHLLAAILESPFKENFFARLAKSLPRSCFKRDKYLPLFPAPLSDYQELQCIYIVNMDIYASFILYDGYYLCQLLQFIYNLFWKIFHIIKVLKIISIEFVSFKEHLINYLTFCMMHWGEDKSCRFTFAENSSL